MRGIDNTWSANLLDLKDYGPKTNAGFAYIVISIENFRKDDWSIPLKNK